jgi:hypothetical protein
MVAKARGLLPVTGKRRPERPDRGHGVSVVANEPYKQRRICVELSDEALQLLQLCNTVPAGQSIFHPRGTDEQDP